MLTICLKCNMETDVSYSEEDDCAVCSSCGGTFDVTPYQVKMFEATGSVIKKHRRQVFMFGCNKCKADREIILNNGKAICKICGAEVNLPPAMLVALKARKNMPDDGPEPVSDRPKIQMGRKKAKRSTRKKK